PVYGWSPSPASRRGSRRDRTPADPHPFTGEGDHAQHGGGGAQRLSYRSIAMDADVNVTWRHQSGEYTVKSLLALHLCPLDSGRGTCSTLEPGLGAGRAKQDPERNVPSCSLREDH